MRDDFGVFILSHGRPDTVASTITALTTGGSRSGGYTGKWWIVLDTEDPTADQYADRWGRERILTFDKDEIAQTFDLADNGGSRGVIIYARNASAELARNLNLTYYMQLDDDYTYFAHRYEHDGILSYTYGRNQLDSVFEAFVEFLDASGALTVAFAQAGDFIGGVHGSFRRPVLRKAMNTFIARVDRPIRFVGRINEDVNTYVWRGMQGDLFLTSTDFAIDQKNTQTQGGGMTGAYLDGGTYNKSFYTVMFAPSCAKISTIGMSSHRVHHHITWNNAVPAIVSSRHKKPAESRPDPTAMRILPGEAPTGGRTRQETP